MTRTQLEKIIREELETTLDESNIFDNIRKKKAYCKKNPSAKKCQREDRPSEKNWKKATQNEDLDEAEKKPCKPSKGKRFAKRVDGKCRSFGQAGQAKGGGDRIRPGTAKGDAYCACSAKIKKCKNPPCANALSRKKWKCRGSKSVAEGEVIDFPQQPKTSEANVQFVIFVDDAMQKRLKDIYGNISQVPPEKWEKLDGLMNELEGLLEE